MTLVIFERYGCLQGTGSRLLIYILEYIQHVTRGSYATTRTHTHKRSRMFRATRSHHGRHNGGAEAHHTHQLWPGCFERPQVETVVVRRGKKLSASPRPAQGSYASSVSFDNSADASIRFRHKDRRKNIQQNTVSNIAPPCWKILISYDFRHGNTIDDALRSAYDCSKHAKSNPFVLVIC